MAEWSKALRSGRNLFVGAGSNPADSNFSVRHSVHFASVHPGELKMSYPVDFAPLCTSKCIKIILIPSYKMDGRTRCRPLYEAIR